MHQLTPTTDDSMSDNYIAQSNQDSSKCFICKSKNELQAGDIPTACPWCMKHAHQECATSLADHLVRDIAGDSRMNRLLHKHRSEVCDVHRHLPGKQHASLWWRLLIGTQGECESVVSSSSAAGVTASSSVPSSGSGILG